MEEFFELKLRNLTMDAYEKIFREMLTYTSYIKYEKVKIKIFISGLPTLYIDNIMYDIPRLFKN